MERAPHSSLLYFFNSQWERMRSLPEQSRRMLAIATMIAGSAVLFAILRLIAPPLQDLNPPSLDNSPQTATDGRQGNPLTDDSQFADASKIPDTGPLHGFLDSFNAAKNLLVPKELQDNPLNSSASWFDTIYEWGQRLGVKAKEFSLYVIAESRTLPQKITAYLIRVLSSIVTSTSRVSQ